MSQPQPPSRLPRRLAQLLAWIAGIACVVALAGFVVAPPIVKSKAEEELSRILHRPVTIEKVAINPFVPSVTVRRLAVMEKDGSAVAASFEELYVDVSYRSLLRFAPILEAVTLQKPYLRLVRNADRSYNTQDLLDEALAQPPSAAPPRFAVHNITVRDGHADFHDRVEGKTHTVTDLRLGVPFVSSLPSQADITVVPELAARVNGTPFEVQGETKPFKDTRETSLALDIDGLDVARYVEYSPVPLPFAVRSGRLHTRLRLALTTRGEKLHTLTLGGYAALSRVALEDSAGAPLAAAARVAVDLGEVDLLGRKATIRSVDIDTPTAHLVRRKDGSVNLVALFPPAAPEPKPAARPAPNATGFSFLVQAIRLTGGRVSIADDVPAHRYQVALEDIGVAVDGLSNAPGTKAAVRVGFDTDAKGRLDYAGTVQLAPAPAIDGKIEIAGLRLGALYPYYEDALNLEVRDGTLAGSTLFAIAVANDALVARASDLDATISGLRLHFPGQPEPLARVAAVEVKGGTLDLPRQQVEFEEAAIRDAVVNVVRDRDGTFLVERAFKLAGASPPRAAASTASDWRVDAKLLRVERADVSFEDRSTSRPARLRVAPVSARIEHASTAKGARHGLALDARTGKAGRLALAGTMVIDPFAVELRIAAHALPLPPIQPYLDERLNAAITGGTASARGTLRVSAPANGGLQAGYRGDARIEEFAAIDTASGGELMKWRSLVLDGIDCELEPRKALVSEAALAGFYSRLVLNSDATLNLQHLARAPRDGTAPRATPPAPDAALAPPGQPANLRVGRITLQDGNVNFSDFFVRPNYSANLTNVRGTVTEMTPEKAGDVALRAELDQTAPVEIAGRLNPLARDLDLDLKAAATDIELPPMSPYAMKYAGYGIEKGKLSVDVRYRVERRKLSAENHVQLNQLTFGEKVDSPTATKLPVLLAVSLLKDRHGVIDVNLPISGSLDDPQFSVGGLIVQVIVNLLTKAVTAPFTLLAAAFGGGEELSHIEFAAGTAALSPEAIREARRARPGARRPPGPQARRSGSRRPGRGSRGPQARRARRRAAGAATQAAGPGPRRDGRVGRRRHRRRRVSGAGQGGLRRRAVPETAQRAVPAAGLAARRDGAPAARPHRRRRRRPAATRRPACASGQGLPGRTRQGPARARVPGRTEAGRGRGSGRGAAHPRRVHAEVGAQRPHAPPWDRRAGAARRALATTAAEVQNSTGGPAHVASRGRARDSASRASHHPSQALRPGRRRQRFSNPLHRA